MSVIRNKQRLLHLYRYLMKNTDEDHQVTTNDLVAFLRKEDANASRKTVKDDIEVLIQEGTDIVTTKSYYNSYFVGNRQFELPEIRFLIDGIAASLSLTAEQKDKLIDKLLKTLSVYQAQKLKAEVIYTNRRGNEQFYYSIDRIIEAVIANKKIEFQCFDYSPSGEKILKDGGKAYTITPLVLKCSNNRSYVVGIDADTRKAVIFRLDLMTKTKILDEEGDPGPDKSKLDEFVGGLFQMQTGPLTEVVLECDNDMMETVIDKFGENIDFWKSTSESFYVKAPVCVSNAFYAWVFMHDGKVRLVSPSYAVNGYTKMLFRASRQESRK